MRVITTHHTNEVNKSITIEADDRDVENGGASHRYRFHYLSKGQTGEHEYLFAENQSLAFQHGAIAEVGVNGVTNEVAVACVIDRLEGFQLGKWPSELNQQAIDHFKAGLACLEERTKFRELRGVEGKLLP